MPQTIRLNRISLATLKDLSRKYRKIKWYYKILIWLSIAGLPALALLDISKQNAGLLFAGLTTLLFILHIVITYTKYVALMVPNLIHIMIMPFSFGLYWGSALGENMTTEQFFSLYSQGSLFGAIYTIITIPVVFKFTRGKPWLTFSIIYFCVDFLSLIFTQIIPQMGLFTPITITAIIIFLRSKIFHKLVSPKSYELSENSIIENNISKNNLPYFFDSLNENLSSNTKIIELPEDDFFNYMIMTPNRIFLCYALELKNQLKFSLQDQGTQISYKSSTQNQELGIILQEAARFSKKMNIPSKDITPIVLANKILDKKKPFIGVNINQKGASLKGNIINTGMVYFLSLANVHVLEKAWKKHFLSSKSIKFSQKYNNDDSEKETKLKS